MGMIIQNALYLLAIGFGVSLMCLATAFVVLT